MTRSDARRFLAALAHHQRTDPTDESVVTDEATYGDSIDAATAATENLASAAAFLAANDLAELEAAIERADSDLSVRAEDGREAYDALRELRSAAVGDGQFQSGRGSTLGRGDEPDTG